jgi:hypothetical protein
MKIFDGDEAGYQQWACQHPAGYVLNSCRTFYADRAVLHTAACRSIRVAAHAKRDEPFTCGDYIKICADDPAPLRDWVVGQGGRDFTKRHCCCR